MFSNFILASCVISLNYIQNAIPHLTWIQKIENFNFIRDGEEPGTMRCPIGFAWKKLPRQLKKLSKRPRNLALCVAEDLPVFCAGGMPSISLLNRNIFHISSSRSHDCVLSSLRQNTYSQTNWAEKIRPYAKLWIADVSGLTETVSNTASNGEDFPPIESLSFGSLSPERELASSGKSPLAFRPPRLWACNTSGHLRSGRVERRIFPIISKVYRQWNWPASAVSPAGVGGYRGR